MKNSLPRAGILRGHGAFTRILSKGDRLSSGSVRLYVGKDTLPARVRVGFAVTRTVRNAAVRNKIRRCMREAFRLHQHLVDQTPKELLLLYIGKTPRRTSLISCRKTEQDIVSLLRRLSRKEA